MILLENILALAVIFGIPFMFWYQRQMGWG